MTTARHEVARWWSVLDHGLGEPTDVRTIARGASGAAVYRITAGRELVLKVAAGQAARRELRFYRELAPHVPVLVPKLVAGVEHPEATCLLLESAGVPPRPARWSEDRWVELATGLGGLHRDQPVDWPSAKSTPPATDADIAAAQRFWQPFDLAWPELDHLAAAQARLPICLRHGDWHLGNILVDPADRFVWIDWQEAGIGRGPEDLTLLWQRAEFDGLAPPRDAMLTAYAGARGIPADSVLRTATVAAELTMLLLSWPPHLTGAAEPSRNRMLRRLTTLLNAWDHGSAGGQ